MTWLAGLRRGSEAWACRHPPPSCARITGGGRAITILRWGRAIATITELGDRVRGDGAGEKG